MRCEKLAEFWSASADDTTEVPASLREHVSACPDCTGYARGRDDMLVLLSALPEPVVPSAQLRHRLAESLDEPQNGDGSLIPWWETVLAWCARPIQVGLATACVVLAVSIAWQQVRTPATPTLRTRPAVAVAPHSARVAAAPGGIPGAVPVEQVLSGAGHEVPRLSPAEVQQFLDKMAAFRASHPEVSGEERVRQRVSLVGYRLDGNTR